jgi:hypothetical protein
LVLQAGVLPALSQLPAPTALSDADFARCGRHTCTWVPWSKPRTFQRGAYSYTVEVPDENQNLGFFVLRQAQKELLRTPLKDLSASTSVVWSDDDRHFAITWSNGGAIGGFEVRVFQIDGASVTELPAISKAFEAFKARHWCEERGDNIQAYRWAADSKGLILVLSVYPTSDCGKEMGHTEAYVVDAATGNIREHWSIKQLNQYLRSHPE